MTLFRRERRKRIVELVERDGRVEVEALAAMFNVGVDSIRKDLQDLSKEGKLVRVYGGATRIEKSEPSPAAASAAANPIPSLTERRGDLRAADDLAGESAHDADYASRLAVAKRAYFEINDGDSIFLDVSDTNVLLADLIAEGDKKVIVTTNMIDVMRKLGNAPHVTVLGTGGYLNVQLSGFVGSATVSLLEPLLFAKAFVGTSGIDLKNTAVMSDNIDSGSVKERVIRNASYKFLLADEQKFNRHDAFRFASLTDFSGIITDAEDPEILRRLQELAIPTLRAAR